MHIFVKKQMKSLHEILNEIKDFRRKQGQRFKFADMLEMIVLAGLSGIFSINGIRRFIHENAEFFIERYELKHGVPSLSGIYNFLERLDYEELNKALKIWMDQYIKGEDIWISIDGKVLGSTVSDEHNSKQNFKSIVSAFRSEKKLTLITKGFENKKKEDEIMIAREIIKQLEDKGVTMTLDALHCQKKRQRRLWWEEMTI